MKMDICVLPRPKKIEIREGYLCIAPLYSCGDASFERALAAFSDTLDRLFGLAPKKSDAPIPDERFFTPLTEAQYTKAREETPKISSSVSLPGEERSASGFFVVRDGSMDADECRIDVSSACRITAGGEEGLARAFSIVYQISRRTCDKYFKIPKCTVYDKPDNGFRGLLVDVARRWHPVDYLYRYVDLCSLSGINRLILHFTDDESYTLPSDVFPSLPTEGRHYTKEELRALDSYAGSRGVMIIPEIDMPGHSAQFATKYPDIFGTCGIMDATDAVFTALSALYKEVSELFPRSEYVHSGGDEAILGRWNDSEKTIAFMRENGISDIVDLYGYFVGRVCDGILSIGKTPIVWEGFGEGSNRLVSKDVLVISWENMYQTADKLVDAGFHILNASWRPLYCVSPWQKWSPEEILAHDKYTWDHFLDVSPSFNKGVRVPEGSPVEGGLYCAWGDYLKNYESSRLACQLEYASVEPRLCALAENLWNGNTSSYGCFDRAYEQFRTVLSALREENPFRGKL